MTTRLASLALALARAGRCRPGCAPRQHRLRSSPTRSAPCRDDCTFSEDLRRAVHRRLRCSTSPAGHGDVRWPFEVHNQLTNNADEDLGQVNTDNAHLEGYTVDVLRGGRAAAASTDELPSIRFSTQQVIPAAGTTVVGAYVIPQALVERAGRQRRDPRRPGLRHRGPQGEAQGALSTTAPSGEAPFNVPGPAQPGAASASSCPDHDADRRWRPAPTSPSCPPAADRPAS